MISLSLDQNVRGPNKPYAFSNPPKVLQERRKYREQLIDVGNFPSANLAQDKRLARGNSFPANRNLESGFSSIGETKKGYSSAKKQLADSIKKGSKNAWARDTPEPVEGRQHMKLQTELYLEELADAVEESEVSCQTDPFLDRPPTPLYVPAKTGIDQETQIYEGELFDFDVEVQPILEVLVGKVTEQALIEVMEEEELASLRERQRIFEDIKEAELQEQMRLEEQAMRKKEEKEKRMRQQREKIRQDNETAEKIAAKTFAQGFLTDLMPSVFAKLTENGYFHDPVEREIESKFMPSLTKDVKECLKRHVTARRLLDGLIRHAVLKRKTMRQEALKLHQREVNSDEEDEVPVKELTTAYLKETTTDEIAENEKSTEDMPHLETTAENNHNEVEDED